MQGRVARIETGFLRAAAYEEIRQAVLATEDVRPAMIQFTKSSCRERATLSCR